MLESTGSGDVSIGNGTLQASSGQLYIKAHDDVVIAPSSSAGLYGGDLLHIEAFTGDVLCPTRARWRSPRSRIRARRPGACAAG
ncbi:hypothetical protein HK414_27125 [Ramlibacter terrae]|uniref:DUF2345 domain-containing protein n=1 Tax=Ramlibacter terrae TaxID=2732511 RepID=A0ABX6P945_9BURK|nr:hypothetical protein HK414_27125 [Ramlibacter terrae]